MTGEPVAPRCLSVFTSLHLTANCSRRSREANSVVWEAEIIQMDGSHDPHIPPAWISLAGLVECGEGDDVMTNRATASVPLPAAASPHCLFVRLKSFTFNSAKLI